MTEKQEVNAHYPANEPILLGDDLRLSVADAASSASRHEETFTGQAWLRLAPPRPSLEVMSRTESPTPWNDRALTLAWGAGNAGKFFQTQQRTILAEDDRIVDTRWSPSSQPILVRSRRKGRVSEIRFSVINFPRFCGRGDELRRGANGSRSRHGRVQMAGGPWRIELTECGNFRDILDELDSSCGFAITHHGRVVRSDQGQIDTEEACLLLRALDDFLSFARGACCSLALVRPGPQARKSCGNVGDAGGSTRGSAPWGLRGSTSIKGILWVKPSPASGRCTAAIVSNEGRCTKLSTGISGAARIKLALMVG